MYYLIVNREPHKDINHAPIERKESEASAVRLAQNLNARRVDVVRVDDSGIAEFIKRYPLTNL